MKTNFKKLFSLFFLLQAFSFQSFLFAQVHIQSNAVMRLDRVMLFTGRPNMIIKKAGRSSLFLILRQGEKLALIPSLRQAEKMGSS